VLNHVGFYLEKYGNLELYANYAIEGRHRYNKQVISSGTNGFGRADGLHNIQFQQLTRSLREDHVTTAKAPNTAAINTGKGKAPPKKPRRKAAWSEKSSAKFPDIDLVIRPLKHIIAVVNLVVERYA